MKNNQLIDRSSGNERLARRNRMRLNVPYLVMLIIPVTLFLLFNYWPMFGLVMAFQNYKAGNAFIAANTKWVGLKWFKQLFRSPLFFRSVRNTLALSSLDLLISFPMSIILALLLNEVTKKRFRHFASNISLLPYFVSTVVIVGIMKNMLSLDSGAVNNLIAKAGGDKIDFFGSSKWFRPLYIMSNIWKNTGFNAVIFTAAISGIDPQLYEAAALDGSDRFKNLFKITLPCILPTVMIMFILKVGQLLTVGYEKVLLMYSPTIYDTADILSTYSYRLGIIDGKTSLATAINLFNAVCNLILLWVANTVSKKASDTSLF